MRIDALGALLLVAALTAVGCPWPVRAAPASCAVVDGRSIAGVEIGSSVQAALAVTGAPVREQQGGGQVLYTLPPPWALLVAEGGVVVRLSTRSAECRTTRGVGPGSPRTAVREAYAGSAVSTVTRATDGEWLGYPYSGVAFFLQNDRVVQVDVFRADVLAAGPPRATSQAPAPAAAGPSPAPGAWGFRTLTARIDNGTLVVTGVVENRSRGAGVYAEVRAFNPSGVQIGQGESPLAPNPVPAGGTGSFEVRVLVADVVRRYTVVIRPIGTIAGRLAEATREVAARDMQQFADVVARQMRVEVQTTTQPANRDTFVVSVTNGSSLLVASAVVAVDLTVTCVVTVSVPAPPVRRTIQENRSGSVTVTQLRPGASARLALPISAGACPEFLTWQAQARVGEVRIGDGN
jgi:hypothetical protein